MQEEDCLACAGVFMSGFSWELEGSTISIVFDLGHVLS